MIENTNEYSYADIEPKLNNDFKKKIFKVIKNKNIPQNANNSNNLNTEEMKFEKMFEKLIYITNNISDKINDLDKKFDSKISALENKITILENKIESSQSLKTNEIVENNDNLKELVLEDLDIDRKDVIKALTYRDYRSLTYILKLYYKNENNKFSFRQVTQHKFEYYCDNKWNSDLYGDYTRNIFCKNLQNLFIKYNNMDNDDIDMTDFMLNQDFIYKLMDEKKKKELFKSVCEEIKIHENK